MILCNFLSRLKQDTCDLHEIILISFNMQEILQAKYCNTQEGEQEGYLTHHSHLMVTH